MNETNTNQMSRTGPESGKGGVLCGARIVLVGAGGSQGGDGADVGRAVELLRGEGAGVIETQLQEAAACVARERPDLVVIVVEGQDQRWIDLIGGMRKSAGTAELSVVVLWGDNPEHAGKTSYGAAGVSSEPDEFARVGDGQGLVERVAAQIGLVRQRQRTQEALLLSEKQLKLTVGICRVATWRFDMRTGVMRFDDRMRELWGETGEGPDFALDKVLERVHPDDLQRVSKSIREAMNSQGTGEYEVDYRIIRPDRTQRWVATNGIARYVGQDGEKKIFDFTGTALDITHRKVTEVTVLRAMARFKLLSETAERLLASKDAQSVVDELCKAVAAHLKCDCFLNYLVNEETGRLKLNACGGIPEEAAKKIEWLDYGGSICGCVAQAGKRIIAENIQDSTDPKTNLVRSFDIQAYACHPLMVEGKTIGTLSFGARNRATFSEDDLELMKSVAGQVAMALERMGAQEKLAASERHLRELSKSLEQRVAQRTQELEEQTTQLRSLAAELTSTEQRERKRLAALLHDDLQQLLVAAKMHMGRTRGRVADPKVAQALERAESHLDAAVESARNLTRQLRPPVLYEAGLLAALKWLATEVQERHQLTVEVGGQDVQEPMGDDVKVLLFECVRELLFNVAKHAGVDHARVEMSLADGELTVVVEDRGTGFDWAVKGKGRKDGFGLFSIRERLTAVGGRLEIESTPGKGTLARIQAPVQPVRVTASGLIAAAMMSEDSGTMALPGGGANGVGQGEDETRVRVLVVDDHTIVREGIANILRSDERLSVVAEAADGVQAINAVEEHRPDVVLLDVNMPRMNGVEAAREIMRRWPKTLIVGLSVLGDELTARTMLEAGAAAFIPKSGDSEQMISTVVGLMAGRK